MAFDRATIDAIGGFDESFPRAAGEDRDLGRRWRAAGGTLAYAPDAIVDHAHAGICAASAGSGGGGSDARPSGGGDARQLGREVVAQRLERQAHELEIEQESHQCDQHDGVGDHPDPSA